MEEKWIDGREVQKGSAKHKCETEVDGQKGSGWTEGKWMDGREVDGRKGSEWTEGKCDWT